MQKPVWLAIAAFILPPLSARAADPAAELAAFSVIPPADAGALLKSDAKAVRGPAMSDPRYLSVQSCYAVPGSPAQALAVLRGSSPGNHHDPRVFVHADLPGSPSPASFEKLRSAPLNAPVQTLINNTLKGSNELQISRDEAKKLPTGAAGSGMPDAVSAFWSGLLSERAQSFVSAGAARQAPYDFARDGGRPGDALAGLLRQQEKIRRQFAAFLGESGITGGRPSLKPELYFELIRAEEDGVLTLGAFTSRAVRAGYQAADVLYYASGGFDVSLTLYQMWPVDAGGQPATLIWRGDLISSANLASLRGVERLGSESVMIKDVIKSVTAFKRDSAGNH